MTVCSISADQTQEEYLLAVKKKIADLGLTNAQCKVFVVVGESSGDLLASEVVAQLRKLFPEIRWHFKGIVGERSQNQGVECFMDFDQFAVLGLFDALKRLPRFLKAKHDIKKELEVYQPDIIFSVDAKALSIRVHREAGGLVPSALRSHLVAPSVWFWKKVYLDQYVENLDLLLTLFDFEPEYFEGTGLSTYWVGHARAERCQVARKEDTLLLLPGSRMQEVQTLLPIALKVLSNLHQQGLLQNIQLKLLVAEPVKESVYKLLYKHQKCLPSIECIEGEEARFQAMQSARWALTASGTATLELALSGVASVVFYKVSPLSYALVKRKARLEVVSLPNILLNQQVFPECIQKKCHVGCIQRELVELLKNPERVFNIMHSLEGLQRHVLPRKNNIPIAPSVLSACRIVEAWTKKRPL